MANWQRHALPEIEVSEPNARDAVRVALHAVFLSRSLGPVAPRSHFRCDGAYQLGFARCGAPEVDAAVEAAVDQLLARKTRVGPELYRGDVTVNFYRVVRGGSSVSSAAGGGGGGGGVGGVGVSVSSVFGFAFGAQEERVVWESWFLPLVISTTPVDIAAEEAAVRDTVLRITSLAVAKSDHLPPPPTKALLYPFEVVATGGGGGGGGLSKASSASASASSSASRPSSSLSSSPATAALGLFFNLDS